MRKHLTIVASISSMALTAQVINGGFEDGLNGWIVPACQEAVTLPHGMPNLGEQCIGLGSFVKYDCLQFEPVHQFQTWLTPGSWVLSGWMSGAYQGNTSGAYVELSTSHAPGPYVAQLDCYTELWSFFQTAFVIDDEVVIDSLRLKLYQDGSAMPYTFFDELSIVPDGSTGMHERPGQRIAFRPNPATDKLWIDLPEAPLSITAIDGTGRSIPLRTFHHNGRTVEVDVSSVPPGLCILHIRSTDHLQRLRFIKT